MTLKEKVEEMARELDDLYELDKGEKVRLKNIKEWKGKGYTTLTKKLELAYIQGMEKAFEAVADLIEDFKVDIDLETGRKVKNQKGGIKK